MSSAPPTATAPEPPPTAPGGERLWSAPAAIVLGFGLGLVATFVVQIIGAAFGAPLAHPTPAVSIVSDFAFDGAFVVAALYFSSLGRRPSPAEFGYRRVRWGVGVGAFLLAGVGYYVITYLYGSLLQLHGSDKLPSELGVTHHTAALVGAAVFVCVAAPMAEEFFFRGFLFGTLARMRVTVAGRQLGPWIAAVITAVLFGLAHTGSASAQYLVPLGILGFVLCIVRWRTGSLYPCMALHSFNNCLALGVNQEHWGAAAILGLTLASWAVMAIVTGPLARREPASERPPVAAASPH